MSLYYIDDVVYNDEETFPYSDFSLRHREKQSTAIGRKTKEKGRDDKYI